jgi:murein L,D-transpeptidase YcbB/YkuD
MTLLWVGSPNFEKGREGHHPTDIVLHWIGGTLSAADAVFANAATELSATFGIENTTEHQYVDVANTSWNAGTHAENLVSVSIEHSAQPGRAASAQTVTTSVNRMVTLIKTVPTLSVNRIYPHNRFFNTMCPGTLPIGAMIERVRAILNGPNTNPPNNPPYPGLMQLGSVGPGVHNLQQELAWKFGYHIVIDGIFGTNTQNAVYAFQKSRGLTVDGVVGPLTWARLWV